MKPIKPIKRLLLSLTLLVVLMTGGRVNEAIAGPASANNVDFARPLIVAIQYDQTYTSKDNKGEWTGPMVDFWKLVAKELKRPYTFQEMSLNNIMSALDDGTIYVAAITAFINAQREEQFDFSTPLGEGHHAIVTPYQPKHEHPWLATMSLFFCGAHS